MDARMLKLTLLDSLYLVQSFSLSEYSINEEVNSQIYA